MTEQPKPLDFEPQALQPSVTKLELTVPTIQARRWLAAAQLQSKRIGAEITLDAFIIQSCDHGANIIAGKFDTERAAAAEATAAGQDNAATKGTNGADPERVPVPVPTPNRKQRRKTKAAKNAKA